MYEQPPETYEPFDLNPVLVELVDHDGRVFPAVVDLDWGTGHTDDDDMLPVERDADGTWHVIGTDRTPCWVKEPFPTCGDCHPEEVRP